MEAISSLQNGTLISMVSFGSINAIQCSALSAGFLVMAPDLVQSISDRITHFVKRVIPFSFGESTPSSSISDRVTLAFANSTYVIPEAAEREELISILDGRAVDYTWLNARDSDGNTPLHVICAAGDIELAERLISSGANPYIEDFNGKSSMEVARQKGHQLLLERIQVHEGIITTSGAESSFQGLSQLMETASNWFSFWDNSLHAKFKAPFKSGDIKTVRRLIDEMEDVNAIDEGGRSLMQVAAVLNADASIIKVLKEAGVSLKPNRKDALNIPSIHLAAKMGSVKAIKGLIEAGADANEPVVVSVKESDSSLGTFHEEMIRLYDLTSWSRSESVSELDSVFQTIVKEMKKSYFQSRSEIFFLKPLHIAVIGGKRESIPSLIAAGAEIDDETGGSFTPFLLAVALGKKGVAEELVKLGADVNKVTAGGQSAYHFALRERREMLPFVAQTRTSPGLRDSDGEIPLQLAVNNGDHDAVALLLKKYAYSGQRCGEHFTDSPFSIAMSRKDYISLGLMINSRHDLNSVTHTITNAMSAIILAIRLQDYRALDLLIDGGVDVNYPKKFGMIGVREALTPLAVAALENDVKALKKLGAAGADLNGPKGDITPLTIAAREENVAAIDTLLSMGADPNYDKLAKPLHMAAEKGNVIILNRLIAANADVNSYSNGDTALNWAVQKGHIPCVNSLLKAGADPEKASQGTYFGLMKSTPMSWAKSKGYEQIEALLNQYIRKDEV